MKHRLILCTHSSLYSSLVLEALLQAPGLEVVGIVNSTRMLSRNGAALTDVQRLLQRSGLRYALHLLLATSGFELLAPRRRLHARAQALGIPLLDTRDINAAGAVSFIRSLDPDVCLSAYFNQIVAEPLLDLPRLGCINIHPSILPHNRGVDPLFHARLRAEATMGVTVHRLDAQLDTGRVLAQQCVVLNPNDSLMAGYVSLFSCGVALAIRVLATLDDNQSGKRQPEGGNYDGWPLAADVARVTGVLGLGDYLKLVRGRSR
uniref:methionyl-tRNA formyltransferase n=1 Tax=Marinobacterium profundum TaxID=1714300 RepID=UPI000832BEBF|nr:formyltransferase family protein [Marinobacterium profundum]